MPQRGSDVDIITGMPLEMRHNAEQEGLKEEQLKEKLQYLDLLKSNGGRIFMDLVERYLEERIRYLVSADAQAQAYLKLLADLGQKEWQARQAVKKLTNRYLRQET